MAKRIDVSEGYYPGLPADLMTQAETPNFRRLRVDVGQTGFFAGREFRTFREFDQPTLGTQIPSGQRVLVRAIVPLNIILESLEVRGDNGQVRITTFSGGTPTGAFVNNLPIIPANGMSSNPGYTPLVTIAATAAGLPAVVAITGGTNLDVIRLKIENSTGAAATVGDQNDSQRGLPAGTYYILVENIGTGVFEGTIKARWEERPAGI